jgi:uncharacterized membrane protein
MVELDLENAIIGVVVLIVAFILFDSILGSVIGVLFNVVSLLFSFALFVTALIFIGVMSVFIYGAYKLYHKLNGSGTGQATNTGTSTTNTARDTTANTGDDVESIKQKYAAGELNEDEFERELDKELN